MLVQRGIFLGVLPSLVRCWIMQSSRRALRMRSTLSELEREYWENMNETERKIVSKSRIGLEYLRLGQFDDAIIAYDEAKDLSNGQKYMWQRGLALFFNGNFREAAIDFRQNALLYESKFQEIASEERLFAAAADALSGEEPFFDTIELREPRPIFRSLLQIYQQERQPNTLTSLVTSKHLASRSDDPLSRFFFAHFYIGLFYDSIYRLTSAPTDKNRRAIAHLSLAHSRARLEDQAPSSSQNDISFSLPELYFQMKKKEKAWTPLITLDFIDDSRGASSAPNDEDSMLLQDALLFL